MTESKTTGHNQALEDDKELILLIKMIKYGWSEELTEVPDSLRKYRSFLDELAVYEDILFRGDRIVIIRKLIEPTLKAIHLVYLGIQHSISIAKKK